MTNMKVEYIEHMGSDLLVVNAARASFGKQSKLIDYSSGRLFVTQTDALTPEGKNKLLSYNSYLQTKGIDEFFGSGTDNPKVLSYADFNLINFLAREGHVLPFRHPHLTLRCKAPIFVTRQLGKHQTGMTWSEESRRYITPEPEFYWPDKWRKKAENVKQGSSDEAVTCMTDVEGRLLPKLSPQDYAEHLAEAAVTTYKGLLESGVAPEQARMILPQNAMVTWVWTGSLLAWVHMLKLRLSADTQKETREFAQMVEDIVAEKYPVSYSALMEEMYSD